MTFYHNCTECRLCINCKAKVCKTFIPPIKEIMEDRKAILKCPDCDFTIESYEIPKSIMK